MHPYVMGAIRLADRRGKFTGDLSPVQKYGLQLLLLWEEDRAAARREVERVDQARAALLVLNPHGMRPQAWFRSLYPDFFARAETEKVEVPVEVDEVVGDSAGGWDFSKTLTDEDEIERVLRSLGQTSKVQLPDADEDEDDEEGWI